MPAVLRQAVDARARAGVCGLIGAPAFGTEVSLDVNTILTAGGSSAGSSRAIAFPTVFLPRLVELWRQGGSPSTV